MAFTVRRRLVSRVIAWLLVVCACAALTGMGMAAWQMFTRERETNALLEVERRRVSELEARKKVLEEKSTALLTERGVEEVLRERYPLVKPGEDMIMIVDIRPEKNATTSNATLPERFLRRAKDLFTW